MDIRSALKEGIARLRAARVPSDTLAAELLLMYALGRDRAWIYAHPEEPIGPACAQRFFALVERRSAGVPTQYLTGRQEFWGLELEITPDVLIPRPETEHVVEVALDRLGLHEAQRGRSQRTDGTGFRIADAGTGSGCIAIALAKALPGAELYATDISPAALELAERNAKLHGVESRIRFIECSLLEGLRHESQVPDRAPPFLDLVASNPPYVGRSEQAVLQREVREHEPEIALYAGEHGHDLYAPLIVQAAERLRPSGILVLELGYHSLPAVRPFLEAPEWTRVGVTNDLAGIPRVIAAERLQAGSGGRTLFPCPS